MNAYTAVDPLFMQITHDNTETRKELLRSEDNKKEINSAPFLPLFFFFFLLRTKERDISREFAEHRSPCQSPSLSAEFTPCAQVT